MPTLLHVDSSPLGESSLSRKLSGEYVAQWKQAHAGGVVIVRDLTTTALTPIDGAWIGANHTPKDAQSEEQRATLALSETLIDEVLQADELVFGVAMHNFSIPSTLKLWIDQVVRAGKTFAYTATGAEGLLKGKKARFFLTSAFDYAEGSPVAAMNHVEPYLRTMFGFLGVTDVTFVLAGGAAAIFQGKTDVQSFLQPHIEAIRAEFASA